MDTKLTLRLDKEVIERAKRFAKEYNTSLSKMVEQYFDRITRPGDEEMELTPLVRSLYGIAALPADFDARSEYFEHLMEKHSPENAD